MKTILLMDIVIAAFGIYMICISVYMWKTKKINRLVLAEEEMKRCKNPEGFVGYMAPRMLVFAVITSIVGVVGVLCDTIISIGNWSFLELALFLAAFFIFAAQLRKAREQFCS